MFIINTVVFFNPQKSIVKKNSNKIIKEEFISHTIIYDSVNSNLFKTYLFSNPSKWKPIILGAKWLRIEWKLSMAAVCGPVESLGTSFVICLESSSSPSLAETFVPAKHSSTSMYYNENTMKKIASICFKASFLFYFYFFILLFVCVCVVGVLLTYQASTTFSVFPLQQAEDVGTVERVCLGAGAHCADDSWGYAISQGASPHSHLVLRLRPNTGGCR